MIRRQRTFALSSISVIAIVAAACSEPAATVGPELAPSASAVKFWEAGASVAWNQTARDLIASRAVTAPIAQVRILTYLSVAQYNAVVTAEDTKSGGVHASGAAASAAASLVVLKSFFPLDQALLDTRLAEQQAATGWAGEKNRSFSAGEAIGRAIGTQVVAYAASDNTNLTPLPINPGGVGYWTGVNPIRGLYGTRTLALISGDQFRPAPPPRPGSAEFTAAAAEALAVSAGLTSGQLAIAQLWAPRGPGYMNSVASEMIVAHHRTERDASRILALANMAAFDVSNACFDAKFAYYLVRPSQFDPAIQLPIGLPNHPSYPSGHSCITSAYTTVLAKEFPEDASKVQALTVEAGLSRNYAGLHFRFDCEVGQELGRQVAAYVMQTAPGRHAVIPLD